MNFFLRTDEYYSGKGLLLSQKDVINSIPFYSTNGILYSRNCRGYNGVGAILTHEINCRQSRIRLSRVKVRARYREPAIITMRKKKCIRCELVQKHFVLRTLVCLIAVEYTYVKGYRERNT